MSGPHKASRSADDRRVLLRALLTAAAVQCESDTNPAMTRSLLFDRAPAFHATIHRPNHPDDHCVQLQVRAPRIRNRIYLTVDANLEGINLSRLDGLVRADFQMRLRAAAGTVMVVIAIGLVAAAAHTFISGPGDVDVAVFKLLWGTFIIVGWTMWMRRLVMAAAAVRGLLEQAFTTVTFARHDQRFRSADTPSRALSAPAAPREEGLNRTPMRPRNPVGAASDRHGLAGYTDVPLWLAALSVVSMLMVVAALVVIAGVLHAPWLGLGIGAVLFIALSTGLRRIARFHARSRSDGG